MFLTPAKKLLAIQIPLAVSLAITVGCSKSPQEQAVSSFQNFEELAAALRRASSPKVYEGLPHNYWEPDQYASERKSKPTITIEDFDFYEPPISATPESLNQLRDLLNSKSSFEPFHGVKACGGFHPDWCLTWTDSPHTYTIFLCFGCGEMKGFKDGKRLILCDLADKSQFESLMKPLHVNRPKRLLRKAGE
jgi:hypothetical protein